MTGKVMESPSNITRRMQKENFMKIFVEKEFMAQ
jgi:hypothetical protein